LEVTPALMTPELELDQTSASERARPNAGRAEIVYQPRRPGSAVAQNQRHADFQSVGHVAASRCGVDPCRGNEPPMQPMQPRC
jgi:hypothetical protein